MYLYVAWMAASMSEATDMLSESSAVYVCVFFLGVGAVCVSVWMAAFMFEVIDTTSESYTVCVCGFT